MTRLIRPRLRFRDVRIDHRLPQHECHGARWVEWSDGGSPSPAIRAGDFDCGITKRVTSER